MSTDARTIATDLIRSTAEDIDTLAISEHLEEHDVDDPDGGIVEEVDKALRAATITVAWPPAGPVEPADGVDLDVIEGRALAATPGPWKHSIGTVRGIEGIHEHVVTDPVDGFDVVAMTGRMDEHPRSVLDAEFIAAARTDVPALAAEVRRLRAELAAADQQIASMRTAIDEADAELPPR